jgi:hypothetical protein
MRLPKLADLQLFLVERQRRLKAAQLLVTVPAIGTVLDSQVVLDYITSPTDQIRMDPDNRGLAGPGEPLEEGLTERLTGETGRPPRYGLVTAGGKFN